MAVVLLGFLGVMTGIAVDVLFPTSYEFGDTLVLPAHSPHSASDLVRTTRDDHPGVLVIAHGARHIEFSATGSLGVTNRAMTLAKKAVIAANDGKVKTWFPDLTVRRPTVRYTLLGLLAGLGTALGFLVPPLSRGTANRA